MRILLLVLIIYLVIALMFQLIAGCIEARDSALRPSAEAYNRVDRRIDDGLVIIVSLFWPVLLLFSLPNMGRKLYRYNRLRTANRQEKRLRIEAEKKTEKENKVKAAPMKETRKRKLDLGKCTTR